MQEQREQWKRQTRKVDASRFVCLDEAAGAEVWYVPPYSPDLNPIELMWSKVKEYLRGGGARTLKALVQAMGEALRTVEVSDLINWFRHAGYHARASG